LDSNNPKRIMHTLRRIFGRANLGDRDVAILRGIFRQLEWYATHGRQKKESGFRIQNKGEIFPVCPEVRAGRG